MKRIEKEGVEKEYRTTRTNLGEWCLQLHKYCTDEVFDKCAARYLDGCANYERSE
jgi:hypothetical protein